MEEDTSVSELLRKREELLRLLQEEDEDVDYEVSDGESEEENDGKEEKEMENKYETDEPRPPSVKRARLDDAEEEKITGKAKMVPVRLKMLPPQYLRVMSESSGSCSQKAVEDDQEMLDDEDGDGEELDVHEILEEAVDKIKKEAADADSARIV
ncbi:unnamed protein product [Strongylus vulgaris]|uniref:Uncharacterized protein n=1 Tax=Strongylus vulgaris TaxID=40348 RepID=A0A3P7JRL1_STRVU|nr:unnamed protein product [Strongylus vulgaris]